MSSIAPPFSPLETTVIALACGERGRGIPPVGWRATVDAFFGGWLYAGDRARTLANPRLEALRVFVNATYRRGGARAEDLAAFLAAGFTQAHLRRLSGGPATLF